MAQTSPFTVVNPPKDWPKHQADAITIYHTALEQARRDINPVNPPDLAPTLTVVFDNTVTKPRIESRNEQSRYTLAKWDRVGFADACYLAAFYAYNPDFRQRAMAIKRILATVDATVNAKDLK